MNTLRKSILIALTVAGLGSSAMVPAQTQDKANDKSKAAPAASATARHEDGMDRRQERMRERMGEMIAKRQARLHDALKLSAQQEPAWTAYQAAIKPAAPATPPARPDHKAIAATPAPERLAKLIDLSKQRTAHMENHLKAVTAFYGQLTAEQKTVFNDRTLGGEHGGFGHHGWGHGERGHGGWGHGGGHDGHRGWGGWGRHGD